MRKLLIFDCDGTVVDSEIISARVFTRVWESMGLSMTVDYFLRNIVGTGHNSEVMKKTRASLPAHAPEIAEKEFERVLENELTPVNGIQELLRDLKNEFGETVEFCAASNSSHAYVVKALKLTDLSVHFDDQVYSARDLANPKPAPDVFLHAAHALGFQPEDCIVIEDSVSGIQAAKNAKMKVVGWTAGLHFTEPLRERLLSVSADFYCQSPSELKTVLREFIGSATSSDKYK